MISPWEIIVAHGTTLLAPHVAKYESVIYNIHGIAFSLGPGKCGVVAGS